MQGLLRCFLYKLFFRLIDLRRPLETHGFFKLNFVGFTPGLYGKISQKFDGQEVALQRLEICKSVYHKSLFYINL